MNASFGYAKKKEYWNEHLLYYSLAIKEWSRVDNQTNYIQLNI